MTSSSLISTVDLLDRKQPQEATIAQWGITSVLGFPTGRDSTAFWDNVTEVPSLSWDKGTTVQTKNLAKGRDGLGQPKFGAGQAWTAKI